MDAFDALISYTKNAVLPYGCKIVYQQRVLFWLNT